ncbi:hypothetical protein LZ554_006688 [Drepanopeziza brunnea f. sp. 'monogermtubi']|nr:hypothetical protein LZ554_006688 [Drepanopeziza brunnea f. sp. 'monogermtubi']
METIVTTAQREKYQGEGDLQEALAAQTLQQEACESKAQSMSYPPDLSRPRYHSRAVAIEKLLMTKSQVYRSILWGSAEYKAVQALAKKSWDVDDQLREAEMILWSTIGGDVPFPEDHESEDGDDNGDDNESDNESDDDSDGGAPVKFASPAPSEACSLGLDFNASLNTIIEHITTTLSLPEFVASPASPPSGMNSAKEATRPAQQKTTASGFQPSNPTYTRTEEQLKLAETHQSQRLTERRTADTLAGPSDFNSEEKSGGGFKDSWGKSAATTASGGDISLVGGPDSAYRGSYGQFPPLVTSHRALYPETESFGTAPAAAQEIVKPHEYSEVNIFAPENPQGFTDTASDTAFTTGKLSRNHDRSSACASKGSDSEPRDSPCLSDSQEPLSEADFVMAERYRTDYWASAGIEFTGSAYRPYKPAAQKPSTDTKLSEGDLWVSAGTEFTGSAYRPYKPAAQEPPTDTKLSRYDLRASAGTRFMSSDYIPYKPAAQKPPTDTELSRDDLWASAGTSFINSEYIPYKPTAREPLTDTKPSSMGSTSHGTMGNSATAFGQHTAAASVYPEWDTIDTTDRWYAGGDSRSRQASSKAKAGPQTPEHNPRPYDSLYMIDSGSNVPAYYTFSGRRTTRPPQQPSFARPIPYVDNLTSPAQASAPSLSPAAAAAAASSFSPQPVTGIAAWKALPKKIQREDQAAAEAHQHRVPNPHAKVPTINETFKKVVVLSPEGNFEQRKVVKKSFQTIE